MIKDIPGKIKAYNEGRVPELLKLKYKAMRNDRYRFFRATPQQFYEDIPANSFLHHSPDVWLCGDLHLENFGSYKGDNRVAYFSINDFDECLLGPCLMDVSRMLTSIYMATANLNIGLKEAHNLCRVFTDTYFEKLEQGYIRVLEKETAKGVIRQFLEKVQQQKRKTLIKKRTIIKNGKLRLLIDGVHALPCTETNKRLVTQHIKQWARGKKNEEFYEVLDVATRIAGTSSLGLRRYVALVRGRGKLGGHFLLDLKETLPPSSLGIIKTRQPKWKDEAERIVEVQQRILSDPPALLASINMGNTNYVLKELQPTADRINYTLFHGNPKKLQSILESMGSISAWSALRSSGRQNSAIADDLIQFAKTGKKIKQELLDYSLRYAKTLDTYYEEYCKAYDKGFFKLK